MEWEWKLIERNCPGCGICADICPHNAIDMTRETAYPKPVLSACIGCMICGDQCPFDAIEVRIASLPTPNLGLAESSPALQPLPIGASSDRTSPD